MKSRQRRLARALVLLVILAGAGLALSAPYVRDAVPTAGLSRPALAQTGGVSAAPARDIPADPPSAVTSGMQRDAHVRAAPLVTAPGTPPAPAAPIACEPAAAGQYRSCTYHDAQGMTLPFYLYLPANYDPAQRYPLVLLLHGGGERADPAKTAAENRDKLLNDPYAQVWGPGMPDHRGPRVQARWPSFVVVPQVTLPNRWVNIDPRTGSFTMPAQPTDELRMAKEIVDTLRVQYATIDASRLYLTGMSIGGYGTWNAIERWPGYFAAAAPICGAGDPSHADRLTRLPIWAFHSADDPIVPVSGSRDMIAAIERAGGHPRYTEYSDAGHGSWVRAYAIDGSPTPNLEFYDWLFAQRNLNPPQPGQATGAATTG